MARANALIIKPCNFSCHKTMDSSISDSSFSLVLPRPARDLSLVIDFFFYTFFGIKQRKWFLPHEPWSIFGMEDTKEEKKKRFHAKSATNEHYLKPWSDDDIFNNSFPFYCFGSMFFFLVKLIKEKKNNHQKITQVQKVHTLNGLLTYCPMKINSSLQ